ncbi:MAG: cytidylyltransferase domain-containing protein, partial [Planctomycetota bacterium]
MSKLYIIIPARLKSKRLPHKILLNKTGKFLVMHTLEAALKSRYANDIFIATDSQEVVKKISPLYKKVFLTPETLTNGTERCLYLAQKLGLPNDAYIVNWQADEPELPAKYVDRLYKFIITTEYKVGTLAARAEKQYLNDPNTVKVVV